ncbi:MAG: hypothetical protein GEV13_26945 [Rhodospirillales bacterium]|nr:hypothetical protein [Rhodospirillales bacterium]
MLVAGLVLSVFGLGFFCWLLFTLAVYALPFLAGLTAGLAAFHSGSGFLGAIIVGLLAGSALLVLGQTVYAAARMPWIRVAIGLIYAVPAAVAGYQLCFGLGGIGTPAGAWQQVFAATGAIVVGLTAFARMALFILPPTERDPTERTAPSAVGLQSQDLRG